MPTIKEFLLAELKGEVDRSRKALEQMPRTPKTTRADYLKADENSFS